MFDQVYQQRQNNKLDVAQEFCYLSDMLSTGLLLKVCTKKIFSYFSTKTYVVGTQKNGETVLLSTQIIC